MAPRVYHWGVSRSPSKRVLWTLVATVAVVGGTIATSAIIEARDAREVADPSNPSMPIALSRDPNLAALADTDGDALLDWEESLRGTDPKVADTDGDGTTDGAEIAAARDPKVAGPNDSLIQTASTTDATLAAEYRAARRLGTLTDRFAEDFASRYVALKSDGSFTQNDQAALLATLSNVSGGGGISTTYRAELVPRLTEENAQTLGAYADAVAEAHESKIISIAYGMQDGGGSEAFGQGFRDLGQTLASIKTPAALVETQAALANSYDTTGSTVALLASGDDPLAALAAIPSLQKAEDARVAAASEIARYLAARGVALQSGRHAAFWTKMVTPE